MPRQDSQPKGRHHRARHTLRSHQGSLSSFLQEPGPPALPASSARKSLGLGRHWGRSAGRWYRPRSALRHRVQRGFKSLMKVSRLGPQEIPGRAFRNRAGKIPAVRANPQRSGTCLLRAGALKMPWPDHCMFKTLWPDCMESTHAFEPRNPQELRLTRLENDLLGKQNVVLHHLELGGERPSSAAAARSEALRAQMGGSEHWGGYLILGVLIIRILLFGVRSWVPYFWKLPNQKAFRGLSWQRRRSLWLQAPFRGAMPSFSSLFRVSRISAEGGRTPIA